MNKIIEEALIAVPCAARLGFLCPAHHKYWASCCRLLKAINAEGQPIEIQELEDNQLHIMLFKHPNANRESYGVVKLIELEHTVNCPECGSKNLLERWNGLECVSGYCTWRSYGHYDPQEKWTDLT